MHPARTLPSRSPRWCFALAACVVFAPSRVFAQAAPAPRAPPAAGRAPAPAPGRGPAPGQGSATPAGPDTPASREARELFSEGVALAEQERWGEALVYFQRSLALVRRPNTLFNIGNALSRLSRARDAVAAFDEFLRVANPERDATRIAEAQRLRDRSYASIATLVFTLTPADAEVRIDGELVPGTIAVRQLQHDPGSHNVEVTAAGYATSRFTVALLPGGRSRRDVELVRSATANGFLDLETNVRTASVRLDGRLLGRGPRRYEVAAGRHLLLLSASGFRDAERSLNLLSGQSLQLTVRMRPERDSSWYRSPVFWVLAGVVVVGGASAAVAAAVIPPPEYGGSSGIVLPTSAAQ